MKNKLNDQTASYLIYPLICAILITTASLSLSYFPLPVLLQIEYAIYDPMQRCTAMTDQRDKRYQREEIRLHLKQITCINIDEAFFDLDCERVKRDKLAKLLDVINEKTQPKSVFLDFLFAYKDQDLLIKTVEDDSLIHSLKCFQAPLVLPNATAFESGYFFKNELTSENAISKQHLVYQTTHHGHLGTMMLVGDSAYRYLQFKTDDDSLHSAIYKLLEVSDNRNPEILTLGIPNRLEINYLLGEDKETTDFPVLKISDASQLLKFSNQQLSNLLSNRIVFIGLFNNWEDKYGVAIDKLPTPLNEATSGIYILLNAYLNVVTDTYLRGVPWVGVFILNFLLALGTIIYYNKAKHIIVKKRKRVILEIFYSALGFWIFLAVLYWCGHFKFPFIITSFFYVANQYFIKHYQKYFTKKIKL